MSCTNQPWLWQDNEEHDWQDGELAVWEGIFTSSCCLTLAASGDLSDCFSLVTGPIGCIKFEEPEIILTIVSGVTYSIADAFTDGGHGTGSHWHNTSVAGPPAPAVPTSKRYAEVGGFFGDEECRGISEFTKPAATALQVTLSFRVVDMTIAEGGLSPDPIDGLYGQGPFSGNFDIVGYTANATEELPDFQASGTVLQTIDASALSANDLLSYDITSLYNSTSNYVGIRLQMTTPDYNAGAITFEDFQIQVTHY
jgi:hypothetical protein